MAIDAPGGRRETEAPGGRWQLERVLGSGGSATAWLGRDRDSGRDVVVKVFPKVPAVTAALRREHRLLASVDDPAVVRVLDLRIGRTNVFLVLERAAGRPVDEVIDVGDELAALEAVLRTAEALSALHARGLVHGDLKPSNVFAERTGGDPPALAVKLLDFGMARRRGGRAGAVSGTPGYLAPELLRGAAASPASDLFALGALGYRLFTGGLPGGATTAGEALATAAEGRSEAEARGLAKRAPRLSSLLSRLLATAPADRPASAGDVARAAAELVGTDPSPVGGPAGTGGFVGRRAELAFFRGALELQERGRSSELVIGGAPGSGRSALLARFAVLARERGRAEVVGPARLDDLLAKVRGAGGKGGVVALADDVSSDGVAAALEALRVAAGDQPAVVALSTGPAATPDTADLRPLDARDLRELLALATKSPDVASLLAPRFAAAELALPGAALAAVARLADSGLLLVRGGRSTLVPGFEKGLAGVLAPAAAPRESAAAALSRARELRIAGDLPGAAARLASIAEAGLPPGERVLLRVERGELALDRGDAAAARSILLPVLREWPRSPGRLPALRPLRVRATRLLALAEEGSGDAGGARRRLAALLAEKVAPGSRAGDREERVRAATSLGLLHRRFGELEAAREVLASARREARSDGALLAAVLVDLGHVELAAGRFDEADATYTEAVRLARGARAGKSLADARNGLGLSALSRGAAKRATPHLRAAMRAFRELGLRAQAGRAANNLAIASYLAGDLATALEAWETAEVWALARGEREEAAHVASNRGLALVRSGQVERGTLVLERALERLRDFDDAVGRAEALSNLSEAALRRGDPERAGDLADDALREAEAAGSAGRGAGREAQRRRIEALLSAGHPGPAEVRIGLAAARLEEEGGAAAQPEEAARLEQLRGRLDLLRGSPADAHDRLSRAASALAGITSPDEVARVQLEAAEAALAAGRNDAAAKLASEASAGLAGRAAPEEIERARALAGEARGTDAGTRRLFRVLLDVTRGFAGVLDLDALLSQILDRTLELTDTDRAFLLLVDEKGSPGFRAARDRLGRTLPGDDFPVSLSVINEALSRGRPLVLADAAVEEKFRRQESIRALGLHAILCLPILSGEKRVGLLYLDGERRGEFVAGERLDLLEALAASAGVAIENARARARESRRRDLIATAAHELQTPIASLLTIAMLAEDLDSLDAETRAEIFPNIGLLARRMKTTVAGILDLSRLESGRADWRWQPLDVVAVVRESVAVVAPMAAGRRTIVTRYFSDVIPSPEGDPDRVIQVLVNLLGNAVKYTPEGSRIDVSVSLVDAASESAPSAKSVRDGKVIRVEAWVEIRVADRGPGVQEADRERIFEKFERGGGAAPLAARGAGLGLAISREIVNRHGGHLRVEGREGGGSVFVLNLPLG